MDDSKAHLFVIACAHDLAETAGMSKPRLAIREATRDDLPSLIRLYADDDLGQTREASAVDETYEAAFSAIEKDANHILAVGEIDGEILGTLLLSFLPGLSRHGAWRGQIESMRIARHQRGKGLGRQMLDWAIAEARQRGCDLVQLTSDKSRPDAHRFYQVAGFTPSHVGFKMILERS